MKQLVVDGEQMPSASKVKYMVINEALVVDGEQMPSASKVKYMVINEAIGG